MLVELNGHRIEFDRPEKWVWYDERYTILDLARYYTAVSPWLMPYLERRPIVYEAYPGTINGPHAFEQDPPPGTPRWIRRTQVRGHERLVTYVIADRPATLVYLVSLFMVTVHVWQSTTAAIERPDFLLVDPLVKSSGARGLHVFVFTRPENDYKTVRALSRALAMELAQTYPEQFTLERDPRKRPPQAVYVDWGQVGRGMSIVPPFSARACEGAPISMPLAWNEVERLSLSRSKQPPNAYFKRYNIKTAIDILKRDGDPWQGGGISSLAPLIDGFAGRVDRMRSHR